jgi:CheY-like chemotaxis protein
MATSRILIVEDEAEVRASLRSMLEARGYSVVGAQNGKRALHYLTSDEPLPDLILLDLHMPEMNGWDLVNMLARYTALAGIPTVIVSGLINHTYSVRSLVSDCLQKPVEPEVLLNVVEKQLQRVEDRRRATPDRF